MSMSAHGVERPDHRVEFTRLKMGMHRRWFILMGGWTLCCGLLLNLAQGPAATAIVVALFLVVAWVVDLRIWRDYRCPGCQVKFDRLDRRPSPRNCRKCGALLGD